MAREAPILIIDDDPAWLDLISFHLERAGHECLCSESPAEAAELIATREFSLVVSDLDMPEEDGWSFRRRARLTPEGRRLPFVFLSGCKMDDADSLPRPLLRKSTPVEEIITTIREFRLEPEAAPTAKKVGPIRSATARWSWRLGHRLFPLGKRALDLMVALVALPFVLPFALMIGIAISLDSPGKVIYRQIRVGRGGRHFHILKFRTMHEDAEARLAEVQSKNDHGDSITFKMRADPRITRVGRLLRRSSLDEMPQLFNVLRGDMTLVGPRPPTPNEVARYGYEAWLRLGVTPGLTCLWQVSGRSELPFDEQLALDRRYIQNRSLWGDLKILLQTIPAVLSGRGAY